MSFPTSLSGHGGRGVLEPPCADDAQEAVVLEVAVASPWWPTPRYRRCPSPRN
jgi:hypothetical protein